METQRYANIVPAGVQHVSDRDITVNGITIPAFTLIQVMKTQRVNQVEFHLWQGRGSLTEQDRDTFLKLTLFKCVLMRIGGGGMQAFTYTVPNWRRLSLSIMLCWLLQPLLTEILKGDYWGDGTTFRPERFLDCEGRVKKDEHLIPFSIGKRQCLGETLAKVNLVIQCGPLSLVEVHPGFALIG